jgi:hypothetical protein
MEMGFAAAAAFTGLFVLLAVLPTQIRNHHEAKEAAPRQTSLEE